MRNLSSRRTFLKACGVAAGGAAIGSGLTWNVFASRESAPVRVILWPGLNGAVDQYFWPNGSAMNVITEPLGDLANQITFLRGLSIDGSFNHFAVRSMFTGAPINDYVAPDPTVKSLDQVVADYFKAQQPSTLKSLHLGSIPADSIELFQLYGRSTFFFDPAPVYYDANPVTAYDKIFGAQRRRAGQTNFDADILALTQAELRDLKARAKGASDEIAKIEEHQTALAELEGQGETETPAECPSDALASVEKLRPSLQGNEAEAYKHQYYSDIIDANIDIMARALVCGVTHVATLQNNSADGNVTVPIGSGLPHHNTSHGDQVTFSQVQRWYVAKFRSFLDKLNVPDPLDPSGKTVLDNSIVLWLSECLPVDHGSMSVPCFYAGSAGGRLKVGQQFNLEGATNRHLMLAICQALGIPASDSAHFGDLSLSEIKV
jgi:hypothetical protein